MKKLLILNLLITVSAFHNLQGFPNAPQGETELIFNNSSDTDLIVATTCSKDPNQQVTVSRGLKKSIQLNLTGAPCKIIAIANDFPEFQAVACLDEWGCNSHCTANDPDCVGGACDSYGIGWVRGCGEGVCGQYQKPGLQCGRDNCDICIRGARNSINYGIALREENIADRLFNGGSIVFPLFAYVGGANAKNLIREFGQGPATDFANAVWKFDKIRAAMPDSKRAAFIQNFCNFVGSDARAQNLYKTNPGDLKWVKGENGGVSFKDFCPAQYNAIGVPPGPIQKGDPAGNGYIWNNPPTYKIKCDNGAYLRADKGGCECPPGKTLRQLSVDIPVYSGVLPSHWGCQ